MKKNLVFVLFKQCKNNIQLFQPTNQRGEVYQVCPLDLFKKQNN